MAVPGSTITPSSSSPSSCDAVAVPLVAEAVAAEEW